MLFKNAKIWKQAESPWTDKGIKIHTHTHTHIDTHTYMCAHIYVYA